MAESDSILTFEKKSSAKMVPEEQARRVIEEASAAGV